MEKLLALTFMLFAIVTCDDAKPIEQGEMMPKMEDESLMFVGTYTDKEGHVDGQADGIYALSFNAKTGTLKDTNLKIRTTNPSYLYVDAADKKIYSVNEKVGEGETLSAFTYDNESITVLNKVDALGGAPCYVTKIGNNILTANYGGGNHAVYSLSAEGTFLENTQVVQHEGMGLTDRQKSPHAHMITQNPHTGQVLTADLGTDFVNFYDFDEKSGVLSEKQTLKMEAGSGPRHIDFHPRKDIVYVLNELNGSISVVEKGDENYEIVQNIENTKMGDPEKAGCADIHLHPNGKFLYASNRGPYNSISQFDVAENGNLTYKAEISTNGEVPRSFAIDPSGKYLLVANQNSDNIVVLTIDQENGTLADSGNSISVPTPVCLKFE